MNAPSDECNRPSSFDLDGSDARAAAGLPCPVWVEAHLRLGDCSRRCVPWSHDGAGRTARPPAPGPSSCPARRRSRPGRGDAPRAVRTADPFLAEVATHLIGAGGKRIRPTLTLCAAYAASGAGRPGAATTPSPVRVAVRARPPRLALPRRRHRRGRDPPRRAERQRPLEQHRGDPRRRLPARPRVVARGVARRRRRRRSSRRRSASCAAARCSSSSTSSTSTAREEATRPRSRARPRRCSRRRAASAAWSRECRRPDARRAHPVRPPPRHVLPDRRRRARPHRDRRRARQARRARTSSRASTRCR